MRASNSASYLVECAECFTDVPVHTTRGSLDPSMSSDARKVCRECFDATHSVCAKCRKMTWHGHTTERRNGETWCLDCAG